MKRGSTGIIVGVVFAVIIIGIIGFFVLSGKESKNENFDVTLFIKSDRIFTDCYSNDHCILGRISGNFTNNGNLEINLPLFINYSILDKSTKDILFSELDVSTKFYGDKKVVKKGETELFASEDIFLTGSHGNYVPKGDYILRIALIDVLTDQVITSTETNLKMQSFIEQVSNK